MTTFDTDAPAAQNAIGGLFRKDVTRDIPPVIYFHEQSSEKLLEEVREYIITGGYPEDHPHHTRVPSGIHEQYVRLLGGIARELDKAQGPELPTAWISGFYGSGKSSFAKLLGLALDGKNLPDGRTLAQALLAADTSPLAHEFRDAWEVLSKKIDPIAVVFDIGGVARDHEQIHAAAIRQLQERLGYSHLASVAEYELRLERDGQWPDFLAACEDAHGQPWEELRDDAMADDLFSEVMHALLPSRYTEPMTWADLFAGRTAQNLAPNEAADAIADVLRFRAPGKTLFFVIDEVSQYIHQDEQRMLRLQSFASSLGQRLRGKAWLLVTGQEKLEEASESTVLGKLKGRFPPHLRVHLDATNIRDVVHKRLLFKTEAAEATLQDLFARYRDNLRLYAYECADITTDDFVEVYPMLPGHIDLLMDITSAMHLRSTRVQGDTHAIRGLIQLLGELFREKQLATREVGRLVTFDDIFDVQSSALDNDTQNTMAALLKWCADTEDELAIRAAKAVALLQLVAENRPTTVDLIASVLYDRLDRGDQRPAITEALNRLRDKNFVSYSETRGYKLQSSAGKDWAQERERIAVSHDQASEVVSRELAALIDATPRPRHHGSDFYFSAFFNDMRSNHDAVIKRNHHQASITFDFQFVGKDTQSSTAWIQRSEESTTKNRVIWVVGHTQEVIDAARAWFRSEKMIRTYDARRANLGAATLGLLRDEETRRDSLHRELVNQINSAWVAGKMYFRGREIEPRNFGAAFNTALHRAGEVLLPEVFPNYVSLTVTEKELDQLLSESLGGASAKFMEGELGILGKDAGTMVATCTGQIPTQILGAITSAHGLNGTTLFNQFTSEPYGYHASIIQACLAGLVRAKKIVIQLESGKRVTSYRDPGTQDLFRKERDLKRANIFPATEGDISGRDRIQMCRFFEDHLSATVDREDEALADAVYAHFPEKRTRLKELKSQLQRLPGAPPLPDTLLALESALDLCLSSRRVEETVLTLKQQLDALRDGVHQLGVYASELTEEKIGTLRRLEALMMYEVAQLQQTGELSEEVGAAIGRVADQLKSARPWQDLISVEADEALIREAYRDARQALIDRATVQTRDAVERIKLRDGFDQLDGDGSNRVLRIIREATTATDPTAVAPGLGDLAREIDVNIPRALEEAHDRLDKLIVSEKEVPVVKVRHGLSNRTIQTEEELEGVLEELREQIREQLGRGVVVRLY